MITIQNPIYLEPGTEDSRVIWVILLRKLSQYMDLKVMPEVPVDISDPGLVLPASADDLPGAVRALSRTLACRAALDKNEALAGVAEILGNAVDLALETIEEPDEFYSALCDCIDSFMGPDYLVLPDQDGNERSYQVLFRKEVDGEDYSAIIRLNDDSNQIIVMKTIYDEEQEEIYFEVPDDDIRDLVFAEFCEVFADEDEGEDDPAQD